MKVRKNSPVLQYGKYALVDRDNPNIFSYTRELNGKKLLIVLNFTEKESSYNLGFSTEKSRILLANYPKSKSIKNNTLRPYEAVILELK